MTTRPLNYCALGVILSIQACFLSQVAHASITHRTVALTGTQAAGMPPGVLISDLFAFPTFNNLGEVAFQGDLVGPGVDDTNDKIVWSEGGGSLHIPAREGDQIPGEALGTTFGRPHPPFINNAGQTAWTAGSFDASGHIQGSAIWVEGNSAFGFNARLGRQVQGMAPGIQLIQWGARKLIDDTGQSTLDIIVTGPGIDDTNDRIMWHGDHDSGMVITQEGSQAPGTGIGVNFSMFSSPNTSDSGRYVFRAFLQGSGVDNSNDTGLWAGADGNLNLVARSGEHAPGTDMDVRFAKVTYWGNVNNTGHVTLQGDLTGPGVDTSNDTGIWQNYDNTLSLVVREGDTTPDLGTDIRIGEFTTGSSLNSAGAIGFRSLITGPGVDANNDSAIWLAESGEVSLLARTGNPAPGTDPNTLFASVEFPNINDAGQLVFSGTLMGLGVDDTNNRGLWANFGGNQELIIRAGDQLEVASGDLRTIDTFNSTGDMFNEAGQILFHASFTDGSEGLFVASVPEPATLLIFMAGLIPVLHRN